MHKLYILNNETDRQTETDGRKTHRQPENLHASPDCIHGGIKIYIHFIRQIKICDNNLALNKTRGPRGPELLT